MKRAQRINRISHRRPVRRGRGRLLPILLVLIGGAGVLSLLLTGAVLTASGAGAVSYYSKVSTVGLTRLRQAPQLKDLQPTRILDRHGNLILEIETPGQGLHKNVPLARVPRYMQEAIVATEDKNFWTDPGIDPRGLAGALRNDLRSGDASAGGSTLTQQLVKRLVLGDQRTPQRKLQEMLIAYAVAQPHSGFSKRRVLELYLNTVFFGHQATGIEAAAKVFFNRDVSRLDLAQSAFLAGLVQSPTIYEPFAGYRDQTTGQPLGTVRGHHVLDRMLAQRDITQRQYRAARAEMDAFVFTDRPIVLPALVSKAPYWTDWIKGLLGDTQTYYTDPQLAGIVQGAGGLDAGLTITTTLDLPMYQHAQQVMRDKVALLSGQNVNDAAVVTLDPKTSECLAMVGGLDYNGTATGSQYNMASHLRSPGSSFKLFTYLTSFERGWYPAHMLLDQARSWPDSSSPSGLYTPQNYDKSYHGAVTVRMALANSFNIPAVETIDYVGVPAVQKTAVDLGVTYLRRAHIPSTQLSLTLGSQAVPLWQMAQAYNTVANGGVFRPMASILSIGDAQGNTLYRYHTPRGVQVVAPQYAYLMTSVLKDNYARTIAFGPNSSLQLGPDAIQPFNRPAAVKTGTSQYFKDNLTIGYTPNLLTATWVGNPNDSAMLNVEGVDGAGPIWHDVMEWDLDTYQHAPVQQFVAPPGVALARVSSSGYLASQYTQWAITDVFAAGNIPHTFDNGSGVSNAGFRQYTQDFSVDGGTTSTLAVSPNATAPAAGASPVAGATPGAAPVPGTGANGSTGSSGGIVPYNPGSHANVCNGGYYHYTPVYGPNGQLQGYNVVCQ